MPSALRELEALFRIRDAENLRALLAEEASALGGELGLATTAMDRLRSLDDPVMFAQLGKLLRRRREVESRERDARHGEASARAVLRLVETARHNDHGVELDPGLLLGPVLAKRAEYVSFHVEDAEVPVERGRLLRARKALRPFPDVRASVDPEALRLRWRREQGALFFRPQTVSHSDRDRVLHVVFERPAPSPPMELPTALVQAAAVARRPRPGAWLRDVLAEIDLGR